MRIGFDAKRLFLNNTGLGNYSRTLVKNLCRFHPEHEYLLYTPKAPKNLDTRFFFEQDSIKIITPSSNAVLWRSFGIKKQLQRDGVELYHGLSNELPFGIDQMKLSSVVTIHDVIFERYPAQYGFFDRKMYRYKTQRAVKEASQVISISHQTTQDLESYYDFAQGKCKLIYQTCDDSFVGNQQSKNHSKDAFYLSVGSVIERKNLLGILKAMNEVPVKYRRKLVVVGTGGDYYDRCRKYSATNGLDDLVEWRGYQSKEVLYDLYDKAIALIYPSTFEGFGIPVIEALYRGCPVITSDLSSLKEAGGEAAILVDPNSKEALAEAMIQLTLAQTRENLFSTFSMHLEQFDPKNLSEQLINLYAGLIQ